MITRLRPEEFHLLAGIYEGYTPDPKHSVAIIAKNNEEIVGRIFLLAPTHIEGIWVDEEYRNGCLSESLVRAAEEEAGKAGIKKVFVYADSEAIARRLKRLGYTREPYIVMTKEI